MTTGPFKIPKIFGILNTTSDSFSDGGKYLEPGAAIDKGNQLVQNGADVIDIGAASSNPDAATITTDLELERLGRVVNAFQIKGHSISIDTCNPEVQKVVCGWGVDFINDIHGFCHPDVHHFLADSKCRLVLMFSIQKQGPATKENFYHKNIVSLIKKFFEKQICVLAKANINTNRIILDPGMGFFLGSNPQMSLDVLRDLNTFQADFDQEILISVSRKSFLGKITGLEVENRDFISLAAELWASINGVNWIRTHDPLKLSTSLRIWQMLYCP